jgi:hypothetical protein
MISLQECLDLTGLDEETVATIARREGIPEIVAAEVAYCLARSSGGKRALRKMITETRRRAATRGDLQKSLLLGRALAKLNTPAHTGSG